MLEEEDLAIEQYIEYMYEAHQRLEFLFSEWEKDPYFNKSEELKNLFEFLYDTEGMDFDFSPKHVYDKYFDDNKKFQPVWLGRDIINNHLKLFYDGLDLRQDVGHTKIKFLVLCNHVHRGFHIPCSLSK